MSTHDPKKPDLEALAADFAEQAREMLIGLPFDDFERLYRATQAGAVDSILRGMLIATRDINDRQLLNLSLHSHADRMVSRAEALEQLAARSTPEIRARLSKESAHLLARADALREISNEQQGNRQPEGSDHG
ncbi:MAG: hypothetical protein NXI14_08940 [bacterium]|nr:hypothetical protein [bacterium]